jgi:signal transduction histidine kinase
MTILYVTLIKRYKYLVHVLVWFFSLILSSCIIIIEVRLKIDKNYLLQSIASIPFYFAVLFLFEGSIAQKTFLAFMDFTATSFLSSFSIWISSMLFFGETQPFAQYMINLVINLSLLAFYILSVRRRVQEMLFYFRESNALYALFPFLSFIFFRMIFGTENISGSVPQFLRMLLYIANVVLVYYILFSHFTVLYYRLQADNFLIQAEQRLWLQKKYYEEVSKGIETQQKLLHDTRHHLITIATLARSEKNSKIEHYLEGLLNSYSTPDIRKYCANLIINATIGGYAKIAEEKGIAISIDVDFPEIIDINEYELCTLIGNTLENAIEACERIPKSSILHEKMFVDMKSKTEIDRLIIRVENSFYGESVKNDRDFRSEKNSGIGLKSVRKVVDIHNGSMSCNRKGNVFVFSAVLCLKELTKIEIPQ